MPPALPQNFPINSHKYSITRIFEQPWNQRGGHLTPSGAGLSRRLRISGLAPPYLWVLFSQFIFNQTKLIGVLACSLCMMRSYPDAPRKAINLLWLSIQCIYGLFHVQKSNYIFVEAPLVNIFTGGFASPYMDAQ